MNRTNDLPILTDLVSLINANIEETERKTLKNAEKAQKKNSVVICHVLIDESKDLYLDRVDFNGPVIIATFSDNTKTKAKSMTENYDADAGLAVCLCKKLMGEENFYKLLKVFNSEKGKLKNREKDSVAKKDIIKIEDIIAFENLLNFLQSPLV